MKQRFKQITSGLLVLCMFLGLVPQITLPAHAGFTMVTSLPTGTGARLQNNYIYQVNSNTSVGSTNSANYGLVVDSYATVVIYIAPGATLTVQGGNGSYDRPGYAGIYLPSTSSLIITGGGTLNAYGGSAGRGSSGGNGYYPYMGGPGGAGSGGAAAGIGGSGGWGGSGGSGGNWQTSYYGYSGSSGSNGSAMGTLYVLGTTTVRGYAGSTNYTRGSGGYYGGAGSAGNGGGGGGGGYASPYVNGIGGGAGGGGGGGGGASAHGGWGGAGGGGGGGEGGGGTAATSDYISTMYGKTGGGYWGGAGGRKYPKSEKPQNGGDGGRQGDQGGNGSIYIASTAGGMSGGSISGYTSTHSAIQYTVNFDRQNGTGGSNSATVYFGIAVPSITVPTRPGYSFMGYYTGQNGTGTQIYTAAGTAVSGVNGLWRTGNNSTLYARWATKNYSVTYSNNGGIISSGSYTTGYDITKAITVPDIYREGHKFSGWKVTGSGAAGDSNWTLNSSYVGAANAGMYGNPTLTAQWALESYRLSFETSGGNETFQAGDYSYNSLLPTPTRTGYTFKGWKLPATDGGAIITRVPDLNTPQVGADKAGETKLTAQWELAIYTVYTNTNGGDIVTNANYTINDSAVTLPEPVRPGYTFDKWLVTMADGNWKQGDILQKGSNAIAQKHGTIIVTAQWRAVGYTVKLDPKGGTVLPSDTISYSTSDTNVVLPQPKKDGYGFDGWRLTASGAAGSTWSPADYPAGGLNTSGKTGDITLEAKWVENAYTISYDLHLGTLGEGKMNPIAYNITSSPITLENPTRLGYTFAGWSGSGLMGTANLTVTIPTGSVGNRYYVANWTPNRYTVTLNANGGAVNPNSRSVTYDQFYGGEYNRTTAAFTTPLPTPTLAGSKFKGWYTKNGTGNDWGYQVSDYTIYSADNFDDGTPTNVTLYARWEPKAAVTLDVAKQEYDFDGTAKPFAIVNSGGVGGFILTYTGNGLSSSTTPPTKVGIYTVTITRAEDDRYGAFTNTATLEIKAAAFPVTAIDYTGYADDGTKKIQVIAPSGATIAYKDSSDSTYVAAHPDYIAAGEYTVDYKVAYQGGEVTGSATVTLAPGAPAVTGDVEKITGVDDTMEYRLYTDIDYTPITSADITNGNEIAVTSGLYFVRYADNTYGEGRDAIVMVLPAGDVTATADTIRTTYGDLTSATGNLTIVYGGSNSFAVTNVEATTGSGFAVSGSDLSWVITAPTGKNAGIYYDNLTVTYEENGAQGGTMTVPVCLVVEKAKAPITLTSYIGQYDEQPHGVGISGDTGFDLEYSRDGGAYGAAEVEETNATQTPITVGVQATDPNGNYEPFTGTAFLFIHKKLVAQPSVGEPLQYTGSPIAPSISSTADYTASVTEQTDIGTYTGTNGVQVALTDGSNTCWAGGGTTPLQLSWSIVKMTVYVKGDSETITYGSMPTGSATPYRFYKDTQETTSFTPDTGKYTGTVNVKYDYLSDYLRFDPVGNYQIIILTNGLTSTYYDFVPINGVLTVEQKEVSLLWEGDFNPTYDGSSHQVTAQVRDTVGGDTVSVQTYTNNSKTDAGTYAATVTALSSSNYKLPINASQSWAIQKAAPSAMTISMGTAAVYGDTQTLSITGGSGEVGAQVAFTVADGNTATISGKDITFKTTNLVTITAKQTGSKNYLDASATLVVTPDKRTVRITGVEMEGRMYDGSTRVEVKTGKTGTLTNVASFDNTTTDITLNAAGAYGTIQNPEVGNGKSVALFGYVLGGPKANHYLLDMSTNVTVNIGALKISAPASPAPLGYNGQLQQPSFTPSAYYTVSVTDGRDVGTYQATAKLNSGYSWEDGGTADKTIPWSIEPAELTFTANEYTIVYGSETDSNRAAGYMVTGFMGNDTETSDGGSGTAPFTANISYEFNYSKGNGITTNDRKYQVTPKIESFNSKNYKAVAAPGNLVVQPLTAEIEWTLPADAKYTGNEQVLAASVKNKVGSDDVSVKISVDGNVNGTVINAGTYVLEANQLDGAAAENYRLPDNRTKQFTVDKQPITITAKDRTITYGDTPQPQKTVGLKLYVRSGAADSYSYNLVSVETVKGMSEAEVKNVVGVKTDNMGDVPVNPDNYQVVEDVARWDYPMILNLDGSPKLDPVTSMPMYDTSKPKELSLQTSVREAMNTKELIDEQHISVSGTLKDGIEVELQYTYGAENDAGKYSITPAITGQAGENYTLVASPGVLTVEQKQFALPTLSRNTFDYTGDVIYAAGYNQSTQEMVGNQYNLKNFDPNTMYLRGEAYTEGGSYYLYVSLKSTANYRWKATPGDTTVNSAGDVVLPWFIVRNESAPMQIKEPVGGTGVYEYGDEVKFYTEGGAGSGAVVWGVVSGQATIDGSGNLTVTGLGDITIYARKKSTGNHEESLAFCTIKAVPRKVQPVLSPVDRDYNGNTTIMLKDNMADLVKFGDLVTLNTTKVSASVADKNNGENKQVTITGQFALAGNKANMYELIAPVTEGLAVDITKRMVTVAAVYSITYGDRYYDNAEIDYGNFVSGESLTLITGRDKLKFTPAEYNQFDPAGDYPIQLTGVDQLSAENYNFQMGTSKLTVKQRPVSLRWDGTKFDFDGGEKTVTAAVTNAVNQDQVAVATYENNAARAEGVYQAVAKTLGGSAAANYTLENANGAKHNWGIGKVDVPSDMPSSGGGTGGGIPSGGGKTPVIVDGESHNIGSSTTEGDKTTITVDQKELQNQIDNAGKGSEVYIPVGSNSSTTVETQLTVSNLETMAKKEMSLIISVGDVKTEIPSGGVNTKNILSQLEQPDGAKVPISVTITQISGESLAGNNQVGHGIQVALTAQYNGKTTDVGNLTQYMGTTLAITPEQARQVTTAMAYGADGTTHHVPTNVYEKDNQWYVTISGFAGETYALVHNTTAFSDVNGTWFAQAAAEMAGRAIVTGRPGGEFAGTAAITRGEFAVMIARAMGLPAVTGTISYSDVGQDAWYFGSLCATSAYGITMGNGDGTYRPEDYITREEAMAIIQRAAQVAQFQGASKSYDNYEDAVAVSPWARAAVEMNVGSGLILGYEGQLRPADNITRGETATVLLRLLQKSNLIDMR